GANAVTLTVQPINDLLLECDETIVLAIITNAAYSVAATSNAVVTIADNELATLTLAATDPTGSETGLNPGAFTITRAGCTNNSLTAFYTVAGTATDGTDYTALSGNVVIPAGQLTATIPVT